LKKVLTNKKKCEILKVTPSGIYEKPKTPKQQGRSPCLAMKWRKKEKRRGKDFCSRCEATKEEVR